MSGFYEVLFGILTVVLSLFLLVIPSAMVFCSLRGRSPMGERLSRDDSGFFLAAGVFGLFLAWIIAGISAVVWRWLL